MIDELADFSCGLAHFTKLCIGFEAQAAASLQSSALVEHDVGEANEGCSPNNGFHCRMAHVGVLGVMWGLVCGMVS